VRLDISSSLTSDPKFSESKLNWVYALVAPFPTVIDGLTFEQLRAAWSGNGTAPAPFNGHPLLMDESTLAAFTALWGAPSSGSVRSVSSAQLLDAAWSETPSWAIVPFESIEPRWKVLTIDGQSPIRKGFNPSIYPLAVSFTLQSLNSLPPLSLQPSNYDPSKLTTVILTGVTALVRATAYKMEVNGLTYPGENIRDLMREAVAVFQTQIAANSSFAVIHAILNY
jgi:poly-gamma-glutamate synthesis protein (capsule biosynthesis protein)